MPQAAETMRSDYEVPFEGRPQKRMECLNGPRPCGYISCEWHMLWVTGNLRSKLKKLTDSELAEFAISLPETCVLDVADWGGIDMVEMANTIKVSVQRVHAMERPLRSHKDYKWGTMVKLRRKASELRPWWEENDHEFTPYYR